ncbi:MAG: sigma-54-dependent Fis family transcriptional regulator [Candidatus Glassbacteria bacterium]|nr:sigma-54-dependent Fis family transcriptional regulator [Candidatus Glassbacteria bacterium]
MKSHRILVVEDEENQRRTLAGFLRKKGYRTEEAPSGEAALELVRKHLYDLVLTDQKMGGIGGLELLREVKAANPEIEVVLLTAFGDLRSAVQAVRQGAFDYLAKPVDLEELELTLERALERRQLVVENRMLRESLGERQSFEEIISVSDAMESVLNMASRVARVDSPVLITGESGTGKEMVAKTIHQASVRRDQPFVAVNCAALNQNLIESELFGHEKGAFTGAIRQRQGKLESADRGTLFLDELGEISPEIQVKLLRFLQEHSFERVGSDQVQQADVRLIAATNRDLEAAIRQGDFREDFYYRINVVNIQIPPLRSRREDIRPLIDFFLQRNRERLGPKTFSRQALDSLLRYDFPGNIRELQNVVERAMVLARNEVVDLADLPPSVTARQDNFPGVREIGGSLTEEIENLERRMITAALESCDKVQVRAAEKLGITERNLRYKMKKLGIK